MYFTAHSPKKNGAYCYYVLYDLQYTIIKYSAKVIW